LSGINAFSTRRDRGNNFGVTTEDQPFSAMEASLKKAAAALRDAGVPFLLGGSLASWARGGPETTHDLDFMIKPEDADRALEVLAGAGMKPEHPPEEWLLKVWDGDVLIDLIHHPSGIEMSDEVIERGETLNVLAMEMKVMSLEDVLTTKLRALTEHDLDYSGLLQIARALREQIDWQAVQERTDGSPFAKAFFVLVEELGIAPAAEEARIRRAD
jgi:predicted nucleotidyltransferase